MVKSYLWRVLICFSFFLRSIIDYSPNNKSFAGSLTNMVKILAKQRNGLVLCHVNTQSLGNKMDEFWYVFNNPAIDVIYVCKTWFTENIRIVFSL